MRFIALIFLVAFPAWGQGRSPIPTEKPYLTLSADHFAYRSFEDDRGGFYMLWSESEPGGTSLKAQHIDEVLPFPIERA